ncbi:MAG: arginase [Gammaproteobacteria bacterium]|nr:arginase [Gammaproteobacteria bacterium]
MKLSLIGMASCWGAQDKRCDLGPMHLQQLAIERQLQSEGIDAHWQAMIHSAVPAHDRDDWHHVISTCQQLADTTYPLAQQKQAFCVYGGDHSGAIGTWSGVKKSLNADFGLIWIDAHMDSHTPQSSHSGAIHGMPLASLLGHGDNRTTQMAGPAPKLRPEQVCVIGVRSYEAEEQQLLQQLKVRVFTIEECFQRGLADVFKEALNIVNTKTCGYGISLDLDAIDPLHAPGVGSPARGGLRAKELLHVLRTMRGPQPLIGLEIAEYNPTRDVDNKTAQLAVEITKSCYAHIKN